MSPMPRPQAFCMLVWCLAILIPAGILAGVLIPWVSKNAELSEAIAKSQDQLLRYRNLVGTKPALQAELERVSNNDAYKAFYFDAPTQALAGAQLQGLVQEIVTSAQGRLISTQLLPEEKNSNPPRVAIRTQIQGSTDSLLDVLYQLERARPFLFVDRMSVRSSARPINPALEELSRPIRRSMSNQGGDLTVRLDIFGFALGGG